MHLFESVLTLSAIAILLLQVSRRLDVPYPTMLAAAGVGMIAIWALLGYVRRHTYTVFVIYRLVLAAAIAIVILSGWRSKTF